MNRRRGTHSISSLACAMSRGGTSRPSAEGLSALGLGARFCPSQPIRAILSACWAFAATGHPTAAPLRRLMNSRRLICLPRLGAVYKHSERYHIEPWPYLNWIPLITEDAIAFGVGALRTASGQHLPCRVKQH